MTNKKQLLDYAFDEAIRALNFFTFENTLLKDALFTSMMGYAERNGYTFTVEEVQATIVAGLETLKKSGADFRIQTWTMK
ncbi:MAG: hypothetical protein IJB73_06365 [Firmicutes bacterium]|nr:hypothetical protein [Bacillota bacterium]